MRHVGLFLIGLLSACSFDAGTAPDGTPWDLSDTGITNPDGGAEDSSGGNNPNSEPNNSEPNNSEPNNSEPNNSEPNNSEPNNSEPNNSEPNNSEPNNNTNNPVMDMGTPDIPPDGVCSTNSDCGGGQTCCPDIGGGAQCQDFCLVGGLCDTDVDCAGNDLCCDLAAIGIQQKVCALTCGTGNTGNICTVTSDCPGTQTCCSGISGASCSQRCWSGGTCNVDADCKNSQKCCDVPFGDKQCFDRCR